MYTQSFSVSDEPGKQQKPVQSNESPELMAKFDAFGQACEARDGVQILAGEALAEGPDATTVAYRNGKQVVTEGPYAEAIEGLGGFYLVEVPHLDVLLDLLHELPRYDIQLSPVVDV